MGPREKEETNPYYVHRLQQLTVKLFSIEVKGYLHLIT